MQTLSSLTQNIGGIVNKAALAGSADPDKYMKKWPREAQKRGGYNLQLSPQDIAALVNHVRPNLKGKRMLCIGVETFGTERFIAEELGMNAVQVLKPPNNPNFNDPYIGNNLNVDVSDKIEGTFDIITLFGDGEFDLNQILQYSKIGTMVACLGIAIHAKQIDLRRCWFELRRLHHPILQNVDNYDTGVGVVKITYKEDNYVGSKKPIYAKRIDESIRQVGSQTEQPVETGNHQTDKNGSVNQGNQGNQSDQSSKDEINSPRSETETGYKPSSSVSIQAENTKDVDAPYGRKLDGTPKKKPGR